MSNARSHGRHSENFRLRDHICANPIDWTIDIFGQPEDEVTVMDLCRNSENIADRGHGDVVLVQLGVSLPAALWLECKSLQTNSLSETLRYARLSGFEI
jgi:hypothetical protein